MPLVAGRARVCMRECIIATVLSRARDPTDSLAITAVQGESHAQFGAVFAAELKAVRAPTRIAGLHRNTAFVPTWCTGVFESELH